MDLVVLSIYIVVHKSDGTRYMIFFNNHFETVNNLYFGFSIPRSFPKYEFQLCWYKVRQNVENKYSIKGNSI